MKEETKCYCGHTTYCDCGPETLEEVSPVQQIIDFITEEFQKPNEPRNHYMSLLKRWCEVTLLDEEVKWQQERSYSEEYIAEKLFNHPAMCAIRDSKSDAEARRIILRLLKKE